jgi:CBS domain-containing protein
MEKITSILAKKQHHFHTILPTSFVSDAVSQMCCENVDHLVVIDHEERFLGVVSEHDITINAVSVSKPLNRTSVRDVMNTRLPVATTNDSVERCMQLMKQFNVRLLPVFEGFNFRGVVSAEDIIQEAVFNRMKIFDEDPASASFA